VALRAPAPPPAPGVRRRLRLLQGAHDAAASPGHSRIVPLRRPRHLVDGRGGDRGRRAPVAAALRCGAHHRCARQRGRHPVSWRPTIANEAAPAAGSAAHVAGSRWSGRRIAALSTGALLVLVSLALLAGGGTGLWADLARRDTGYVTTDVHDFST